MHRRSNTSGQTLIESCVAIFVIGLIFSGLFQISQLLAAKEILFHAAARGARAKTVGFNQWMVRKAVRVAAIPNAGRMLVPDITQPDNTIRRLVAEETAGDLWTAVLQAWPPSRQAMIERARIPQYMASWNSARAANILNYERWDTIRESSPDAQELADTIHFSVSQDYPLLFPAHGSFYAADAVPLRGEAYLENHYPLYIDDADW